MIHTTTTILLTTTAAAAATTAINSPYVVLGYDLWSAVVENDSHQSRPIQTKASSELPIQEK
jgi:hypothetical protein